MMKKGNLLPLAAVLLTAVLLSFYKVTTWDVFWHLKVGQVILETGGLVTTNLFSSVWPDYPWPNPEWLFQVLLALLHGAAGWEGLTVAKTGASSYWAGATSLCWVLAVTPSFHSSLLTSFMKLATRSCSEPK